MNSRLTATLLPALLLAGCAVGPDYAPPDPGALPGALPGGDGGGEVRAVFGPEGTGTAEAQAITALWEIAATNNLDILQAVKRIEASRAALAGSRAEYWPSVGFSAGTSKAKNFNPSSSSERSTLGFDASWELDLFGKVRRSVEAAGAELEASEYSLADALASLRAEIAGECVNLALQRRLLEITGKNLDLQRDFEKIAREKFEAGLAPELDWLSAQSQLFATEASLPSLAASATGCVRRIELLCGLTPGTLDNEPELLSFPPLPEWGGFGVPATVPSELLRRRPDVRRAERAYAAALARVGVSQASYYPSLTIGAGFSLASDSFARWGDAVRSISFGPSVSWSILSFGRTKARVAQAR
ncbi:MAG: efflux transporter outer membrane subunit, partial [Kiritimatiellae bacterium]|nr:efflux transporter outer membrane subunit [Kiritimatiellia bacterium]